MDHVLDLPIRERGVVELGSKDLDEAILDPGTDLLDAIRAVGPGESFCKRHSDSPQCLESRRRRGAAPSGSAPFVGLASATSVEARFSSALATPERGSSTTTGMP